MIVVTAPTSSIGSQVLERLLGAGAGGEPVRVVVRDPARLPAAVRERVEVVTGSHGDPAVVDAAFAGADAVFWLAPPDPRATSIDAAYVDFTRPAATAFAEHGVGHVVAVSALGRGTPVADRAGHVTASLAMGDLIAGTGVAFRALALPSFMENVLRSVPEIRDEGTFTSPSVHDRRAPTACTRDFADVAARLLTDRSWSGVGEVPVLGPEDLSPDDMVAIMTEVLGRPVRLVPVSTSAVYRQLTGYGMSEAVAQAMVDMIDAKNEGLDDGVARTPETSSPTTFRQWCAEVLAPAVGA